MSVSCSGTHEIKENGFNTGTAYFLSGVKPIAWGRGESEGELCDNLKTRFLSEHWEGGLGTGLSLQHTHILVFLILVHIKSHNYTATTD